MPTLTGLSLTDETTRETAREGRGSLVALVVLLSATLAGLGYLGFLMLQRMDAVERQLAVLQARSDAAAAEARAAADRASTAETAARAAAEEGRQVAEAEATTARQETDAARQEREVARRRPPRPGRRPPARARRPAARRPRRSEIRKQAEAEVDRLEAALGQIAETRRTALGLVMNLGSDHLKFEFDKAELRPEDRELLSRVAGHPAHLARLHHLGERPHRRRGLGCLQPEAVRAPRPGRARLPGAGRAVAGDPQRGGPRQVAAPGEGHVRHGPRQEPPGGAGHRQHAASATARNRLPSRPGPARAWPTRRARPA